jgi:hypothetical protein
MSGESQVETEVLPVSPTLLADQTRDSRVYGDPLSGSRPGLDHTGKLMTQDQAGPESGVSDRSFFEPMSIGTT